MEYILLIIYDENSSSFIDDSNRLRLINTANQSHIIQQEMR